MQTPPSYLAKKIFVNRLIRFMNVDAQYSGFVPDIFRILQKYNMEGYLHAFVDTAVFPDKFQWKRILKTVRLNNKQNRVDAVQTMVSQPINNIVTGDKPCYLWLQARKNPELSPLIMKVIRSLGYMVSRSYAVKCSKCKLFTDNLTCHALWFCTESFVIRLKLIVIVFDVLGLDSFLALQSLSIEEQTCVVLLLSVDVNENENLSNISLLRTVCKLI